MRHQINKELKHHILAKIKEFGSISFHDFMKMALYEPGLGYYSAGSTKFGPGGDFTTAPEFSPLFAQCVGLQCLELLSSLRQINHCRPAILELGAGSGKLAAGIVSFLAKKKSLPDKYYILEVSADLRQRQQEHLSTHCPEYFSNFVWLDTLPKSFTGIILANEVLDAMPVHKFKISKSGAFFEHYVTSSPEENFAFILQEITSSSLIVALNTLQQDLSPNHLLNYSSEISLAIPQFIASLSTILTQGSILLFDYGFTRSEYYHPDRREGTLMCHYQHQAHTNPLIYIGIQDITAHIDFSLIADAAFKVDLDITGYTEQSSFLLANCLLDFAQARQNEILANDYHSISKLTQEVQTLTMPHEMGELFKVICLSRKINFIPQGFILSNKKFKL